MAAEGRRGGLSMGVVSSSLAHMGKYEDVLLGT